METESPTQLDRPERAPSRIAATLRRERKRATDRHAQRDYRKRQKEHVRQLEETISMLSSELNSDTRVSALLEEQARLKEHVKDMETKLHRIRNIAIVGQSVAGEKGSLAVGGDDGTASASSDDRPDNLEVELGAVICASNEILARSGPAQIEGCSRPSAVEAEEAGNQILVGVVCRHENECVC